MRIFASAYAAGLKSGDLVFRKDKVLYTAEAKSLIPANIAVSLALS
jgi:hypothetical protein